MLSGRALPSCAKSTSGKSPAHNSNADIVEPYRSKKLASVRFQELNSGHVLVGGAFRMIRDLSDLEPLLGRYDSGLVLVGPVLSLPTSGYCYLYIAASGSKVYEAIGLGFFEDEADTEIQRASIIAILKSRFKEMLTFGSHYEMARVANTRWPNDETVKVLASATPATKPGSDAITQGDSIDDTIHPHVIPSDYGQQLVDDVAREPVVAGSADHPATLEHEHLGLVQDDFASAILSAFQQTDHPPSITSSTAPFSADNRPAPPQQETSGHRDEDIAAVLRALRPSYQAESALRLPAATTTPLSGDRVVREQEGNLEFDQNDVAAISRAVKPPNRLQRVPWLAVESARNIASIAILICAFGGASALLTWTMVRSSAPRMTHEAGPTTAPHPVAATVPSAVPTQQTVSIKPGQVEAAPDEATASLLLPQEAGAPGAQQAEAKEPTQQAEPAPAAMAPPPPTPQQSGSSTQVEAVPTTSLERKAKVNETTQQVEPAPAAMAPPPPAPQQSGSSTQVEAGPATRPERKAEVNEPTQQAEPAPAAMAPPPPTPQLSGSSTQVEAVPATRPERKAEVNEPTQQTEPPHSVAAAQAGVASVSGPQQTPSQESSTILGPDSPENTTLIDRGLAYFKRGDVASARLLFRRAAEAGSASAALMLGSTFDPLIIQQLGVIGIEPDVARARQWYEKAAVLGSVDASQRLAKLGQFGR